MAKREKKIEIPDLKDKINHLLEEIRMVLPGTEALLGFQLAAVFNQGFTSLDSNLKILHLIALFFICFATILLLAPAAYHRIVEKGNSTERLHKFGSAVVLIAMMALAVGLSVDLFVVSYIITKILVVSLGISICTFLGANLVWFGIAIYKKD